MLLLRPYQELMITDCSNAFRSVRRALAVAPTGAGKTVIFSEVTRRTRAKGKRIVLMAHRIEIVEQISKSLHKLGVTHGWVAPGKPARDERVMVAMVQSLARRLDQISEPDLLVIDEAHHATAGGYKKIADAWSKAYILGVTASPARTDGRGLGEVFDKMIMGPTMMELISRGYLSGFTYLAPPQQADFSGVATRAGDYAQDQLAAVMDQRKVTGDAVAHYARFLNGRPAIAFCSSVEHAVHVAEQFREAGWKAASVDGEMDPGERRRRIAAIGNGGMNVLTSCDIVSEGTDIPAVAGAILLRPTQSVIVFLQQVGRVLRVKADGGKAIILDHVGNVFRHGMPDAPREWSLAGRMKREQAPPVRQCPDCYQAFAPAPRCPGCGHVFAVSSKPMKNIVRAGQLAEVDEAKVKQIQVSESAGLLRAAWASKNMHQARDLFERVAKVRGHKPRWADIQVAVWTRYHTKKAAA